MTGGRTEQRAEEKVHDGCDPVRSAHTSLSKCAPIMERERLAGPTSLPENLDTVNAEMSVFSGLATPKHTLVFQKQP